MIHLFLKFKNIFLLFSLFENGHIHNVVSTLINAVKLDIGNKSIVLTLSNVVKINIETDKVDLTLFKFIHFNVDIIHNIVSTLIWHCPTFRRHITLTITLRPRSKIFLVVTNAARRLHNLLKFMKLKTYIFSWLPLNCCFFKLLKRYW